MNFLKYRKYFFANISALWFYFCVFLYIVFKNTTFEPYSHNVFPSPKDIYAIYIIFCFSTIIFLVLLTIFEILIRKYIVGKRFPTLKLNLKIKIPKLIVAIYNIIFSIGFLSAIFFFFIALILLFIAIIMHIFNFFSL